MAQPLPPRKPRRQKRGSGNVRSITPQIFFGSYLQAGFGFGFEVGFASGVVGVGFWFRLGVGYKLGLWYRLWDGLKSARKKAYIGRKRLVYG